MQPRAYAANKGANTTLIPILQRQVSSGRITLNDMYIGDQGASTVADYLRQFPNIGVLDLKGNNIGPQGFIEIFQSLKSNDSLRTLQLSVNNLCAQNNLQALELLFQVISVNKTLTHLDIQNNKLNSNCIGLIANIIRNNPQLKSIDLRWNELGNQGIKQLIPATAANAQIVSVEVQGNGATDETIRELNQILHQNRSTLQMPGKATGSRASYPIQERQPVKQMATHLEEERVAIIRHLEKLIERERAYGLQIREELDDKTSQWKIKLQGNAVKIDSLEKTIAELNNTKNILNAENNRWDDGIKEIQAKKAHSLKQMEEKLFQIEKTMKDIDRKHQNDLNEISSSHFTQMREIDVDFNQRCDQLMDINRRLDDYNQDLIQKITSTQNEMYSYSAENHTRQLDLIEKIKKMVLSEFKEKLNLMDHQINQIDQDRQQMCRSHAQTLSQAQKEYRKLVDDHNEMLKDKTRLEIETKDGQVKNLQFELFNKMIHKDISAKAKLEQKLRDELDKLKVLRKQINVKQEKSDHINSHDDQQISQVNKIHKNDMIGHDEYKNDLKKREEALEKTMQDSERENQRLAGDVNRLVELLQANTTKAIYNTFSENNFI